MALSTYAELQASIAAHLKRSDLTATIPDFIALTEAAINRRLALSPVRPQRAYASLTVDAEFVDAPDDLLKPITVEIADEREISYVDADNAARLGLPVNYDLWLDGIMAQGTGEPQWFAMVGEQFRFIPVPTGSETARLSYYKRLPALSDSATSNWMLRDHPDVYLHGSLAHGHKFVWDDEQAAASAALFDALLDATLAAYPDRTDNAPRRSDLPYSTTSIGRFW